MVTSGTKILFRAGNEMGGGINTMNADGTNRVYLTVGPGNDCYASLSPFLNENK